MWPNGEVLCCDREFYVGTELAKARRNYVATEQFYVATELARVGRIYVVIKDFYVVTELATIESSAAHDKARNAKASTYDSVTPCCVPTEEAMRARQTRLGAHERDARATENSLSRQTWTVTKKKKKNPRDLWCHTKYNDQQLLFEFIRGIELKEINQIQDKINLLQNKQQQIKFLQK